MLEKIKKLNAPPDRIVNILFLIMFIISAIPIQTVLDNDFWFYLSHGRYILSHGLYPAEDPFVMHEGFDITFQRYASSILFTVIYRIASDVGIYLLIALMSFITAYILYKQCFLVCENRNMSMAVAAFLMLFTKYFFVSRAYIFSSPIIASNVYFMEKFMKYRKKKDLIPVITGYFLMIQFHSSIWPILVIAAMPFIAELFVEALLRKSKDLFVLLTANAAGMISMLLNPYGIESILYVLKSYGNRDLGIINEMHITSFKDDWYVIFLLTIIMTVFLIYTNCLKWLVILRREGRNALREEVKNLQLPLRYIFLSGGFGLFSMVARRNLIIAVVGMGFVLAFLIRDQDIGRISRAAGAVLILLPILINLALYADSVKTETLNGKRALKAAVEQLSGYVDNISEADIFTNYNVGAYAEYKCLKCYIDPRAEAGMKSINGKKDTFHEYIELTYGQLSAEKFISRYDFDYYLCEKGHDGKLIEYLSKSKEHTQLYANEDYCIFICAKS